MAETAAADGAQPRIFTLRLTATPDTIDMLGHVNNVAWVQWVQDVATAHWQSAASADDQARYIWVVVRHEIDYLRNVTAGAVVTASTWVDPAVRGAKFDRHMLFRDADGRDVVRARTVWALIDRQRGRPARVTPALIAPFVESAPPSPAPPCPAAPGPDSR